jgi:hypothetical protein
MPKEVINDAINYHDDTGTKTCIAEVSWGKDSESVQMATLLVAPSTHTRLTEMVEGGWFLNLDRSKINQLIRVLRRARDQAFGADE